jgi:hypothetical protein
MSKPTRKQCTLEILQLQCALHCQEISQVHIQKSEIRMTRQTGSLFFMAYDLSSVVFLCFYTKNLYHHV